MIDKRSPNFLQFGLRCFICSFPLRSANATVNEYSIRYKFGASVYNITVQNPDGGKTILSLEVDGAEISVNDGIALMDDGREHEVRVVLK